MALERRSVSALIVVSEEFVKYATADNSAAETLSNMLADEIRKKHDAVFVGTSAAVAGQQRRNSR